jgi:hypothetical protein
MISSEAIIAARMLNCIDASKYRTLYLDAMLLDPDSITICSIDDEEIEIDDITAIFSLSESLSCWDIVQKVGSRKFELLALYPGGSNIDFMVVSKSGDSYYRAGLCLLERRSGSIENAHAWVKARSKVCRVRLA